MPGLKKALRRNNNRKPRPRIPFVAPAPVAMSVGVTRVGIDDGRAELFIGYDFTAEEREHYAQLLASATGVRFLTAGELIVVDLVCGRKAIARMLSNIIEDRLEQLLSEPEVDVKLHAHDDPDWEDAPTRTLPAERYSVSHEELYGPPKVVGDRGLEYVHEVGRVGADSTVHRFRTAAEADAFLAAQSTQNGFAATPSNTPDTPIPESWMRRFERDEFQAMVEESIQTQHLGGDTYYLRMELPGAASE